MQVPLAREGGSSGLCRPFRLSTERVQALQPEHGLGRCALGILGLRLKVHHFLPWARGIRWPFWADGVSGSSGRPGASRRIGVSGSSGRPGLSRGIGVSGFSG